MIRILIVLLSFHKFSNGAKLSDTENNDRVDKCGIDNDLLKYRVELTHENDPKLPFVAISPRHVAFAAKRLATWESAMKNILATACTDGVKKFDYKLTNADGSVSTDSVMFIGTDCTDTDQSGLVVAEIALDKTEFACLSDESPSVFEASVLSVNGDQVAESKTDVSVCDLPSGFCITDDTDKVVDVYTLSKYSGESADRIHLVGVTDPKRATDSMSMITFVQAHKAHICDVTGICEKTVVAPTVATTLPTVATTEPTTPDTPATPPPPVTLPPPTTVPTTQAPVTVPTAPTPSNNATSSPVITTGAPPAPVTEGSNDADVKLDDCPEDQLCFDSEELFGAASQPHLALIALFVMLLMT